MKIVTIVGARPQFIKASPVSKALAQAGHQELLVHTGQHYDHKMSQVFFDQMSIPKPYKNLEVGSGPHGQQTALMLERIEQLLLQEKPDRMLVYGDTNSTLAGALAACKLQIPIAHVEAGLRSYNRQMPEEHNRVLTDHCSDLLFCPTQTAIDNLAKEGMQNGVKLVGDTMYDAVLQFTEIANQHSTALRDLDLTPKQYVLATVHRAYNTDVPENLRSIMSALVQLGLTVVFPVHPRTRARLDALDGHAPDTPTIKMVEPVSYLDMLVLEQNAKLILTDSGGMQKEAYFFGVPCVTLRPETEWVETVDAGWNVIADTDPEKIIAAVRDKAWPTTAPPPVFGTGDAAHNIAAHLSEAPH